MRDRIIDYKIVSSAFSRTQSQAIWRTNSAENNFLQKSIQGAHGKVYQHAVYMVELQITLINPASSNLLVVLRKHRR